MIESLTLKNDLLNTSVIINKTDSPYILDEADFGVIESSHNSSKYFGQIGNTLLSSTLGTRVVSISGWIIGDTEEIIQNRKKVLNAMINPLNDITLTYKTYQIKVRPKSTIKYSTSYKENNEVFCKFLISGICYKPLFENVTEKSIAIGTSTSVVNDGTIETGFEIKMTATGAVKNPKILLSTGGFILIDKTLANGETIVINTNYGEEKATGTIRGTTSNYYRYVNYDSTWLKLAIGSNALTKSATENANMLNVSIKFKDKFLEVQ